MASPPKRSGHRRSSRGSNDDGGASSLLGYLYQLVGTASVSVSVNNSTPASTSPEDFVFEAETFGQDAVLSAGHTVQLIQFKYSASAKPIGPGELADVLMTFERSQQSVKSPRTVVAWILKTNRPLSLASNAIMAGTRPPGRRVAASHVRTIRRLVGQHFDFSRSTFDDYHNVLLDRATRLGVDYTSAATNSVVGLLMRIATNTPELRRIDRQAMDDALAGYSGAQLLSAVDSAARLREELIRLAREQRGIEIGDAISRPDVDKLLHSNESALALVTGHGGSGKTLSVLKALYDSLDRRPILVGALMPPGSISSQSVSELVSSWRSVDGAPTESLDGSLRRVIRANPDVPRPVLVLCLDGLDERRWQERREAQDLVLRFYEWHQRATPSDVLLIITCRARRQFDELVGAQGAGEIPSREVEEVPLDDFSDEEFQLIWQQWFRHEVVPTLDPRAAGYATLDQSMTRDRATDSNRALLHPVFLGFVRFWGEDARAELIAGDDTRWRELTTRYVEWFETKVHRRLGCEARVVRGILRAAAVATHADTSAPSFDLVTHWIDPGLAETGVAQLLLKEVFEDAVTAGLVDCGPRFQMPMFGKVNWQWNFPVIWEQFRSLV